MANYIKEVLNIRISYADKRYPFAANPFAVICLDAYDRVFQDEYFVFYGNDHSPNKEISFSRENSESERFIIILDDLPDEVEQVIVLVKDLEKQPSDLVFEVKSSDGTYFRELTIQTESILKTSTFAVARLFRSHSDWFYSIQAESISDAYMDWLLRADEKEEFLLMRELAERKWDTLKYEAGLFEEKLEEVSHYIDEIASIKDKLSIVNWSKVSDEKQKLIYEHLDSLIADGDRFYHELLIEFEFLCEKYEKLVFMMCIYNELHQVFNKEIENIVKEYLLEYRRFSLNAKEKCGFERTQEQKDMRTSIVKRFLG